MQSGKSPLSKLDVQVASITNVQELKRAFYIDFL